MKGVACLGKRIIFILFVAATLLLPVAPAFSESAESQQIQDQGGPFERIVATIVEVPLKVIQGIGAAAGMKPVDQLIFLSSLSEDEKKSAPWTSSEVNFIKLWYLALSGLVMPFFLLIICISAYKLTIAGVNPGMRAEAINSIWRWFGSLAIIILAPLLVQSLMQLTGIILDGINAGFGIVMNACGIGRPVSDWGGINFGGLSITTGSVLGTSIVKAMFIFIYLWLNTVYLVRKMVVSAMLCFTPVMAILWAANKNVNAAAVWMGEITSNAFMPVAHSLVLCIVLGFCDVKNISEGSWYTILVFMYTLMPLAEVIRNSLQGLLTNMAGLNEERTARGALISAVGLGGMLSLGRVGRATFGGMSTTAAVLSNDLAAPGSQRLSPVSMRSPMPFGYEQGPGGVSPDILASRGSVSTSPGIGFSIATETTGAIDSRTSGSVIGVQDQPRWIVNTIKAADLSSKALGSAVNMTAGAIPGGYQIAGAMNSFTAGGLRAAGIGGGILAQAAYRQATGQTESFGQAFRDATGVKVDGWKGNAQAAGRLSLIMAKTAWNEKKGIKQYQTYQEQEQNADNKQREKRTIGFRPPTRGLV